AFFIGTRIYISGLPGRAGGVACLFSWVFEPRRLRARAEMPGFECNSRGTLRPAVANGSTLTNPQLQMHAFSLATSEKLLYHSRCRFFDSHSGDKGNNSEKARLLMRGSSVALPRIAESFTGADECDRRRDRFGLFRRDRPESQRHR